MTTSTWSAPDQIAVLVDAFGNHVDGAPITYAVHFLDRPRVRRLLRLIEDFRNSPQSRVSPFRSIREPDPSESDLLPSFIPVKATMRNPYYSLFQKARLRRDPVQLLDPAMLAHIRPIPHAGTRIVVGSTYLSFAAEHAFLGREMSAESLDQEMLYTILALLTPEPELPKLLSEMASCAPNTFCRLFRREPIVWFTPDGQQDAILPETFRFDPATAAAILATGSESVRQTLMIHLPHLFQQPARFSPTPPDPARPRRTR